MVQPGCGARRGSRQGLAQPAGRGNELGPDRRGSAACPRVAQSLQVTVSSPANAGHLGDADACFRTISDQNVQTTLASLDGPHGVYTPAALRADRGGGPWQ